MTFKKGQIANPTGKGGHNNRTQKQLRERLLHLVPSAVKELESMLTDPDHKSFAVKEVFDRVYGKAPQSLEVSGAIETIVVNVGVKKPE